MLRINADGLILIGQSWVHGNWMLLVENTAELETRAAHAVSSIRGTLGQ